VEFREGKVVHKTDGARAMPLAQLAAIATYSPAKLPSGMEPGLEATYIYNYPKANEMDENFRANFAATYANVVHAVAIEVEPATGQYKILKYAVVHDAGTLINPMIVDGQVHGAVAHSLGAAMLEEFVYDERGQLLSRTYADYLCPRATEIPDIQVEHMITPSPFTAYGVKGMGEGSGPVPALLAQALEDALEPFGKFRITWSRHTPEKVFNLIHGRGSHEASVV
jgi:2-furoyl-CoA dehydrogenase large subunit